MGPPDLVPVRRKVCCGFLSLVKIHRLGSLHLDPVTSTLTTTPPRRQGCRVYLQQASAVLPAGNSMAAISDVFGDNEVKVKACG
jgi:hypothetical protein